MTTTEADTGSAVRGRFLATHNADEEYHIGPPDDDPTQWRAAGETSDGDGTDETGDGGGIHQTDDDGIYQTDDDGGIYETDEDGHGRYGGSGHGTPVDLDAPAPGDAPGPQDRRDPPDQPIEYNAAVDPFNAGERREAPARRFDPRVALGFAGVLIVAVVVAVVAATMVYGGSDPKGPVRQTTVADAAVAVPAPATAAPTAAPISDRPLPYTADAAGSCPAGSTSAQTMAGADPHNAFVCVRNGIDGQVIDITLSKTFVITAISLTPGWIGQDSSGVAQWSQHRVVTTVQYSFNDTDRTLITQDTKNVHGEAVLPVQRVLASKIRMLIRQTSRPPADTPATAPASPDLLPGLPTPPTFAGDPLLGTTPSNADPVDHTFAVSSLKIIGHEAL